MSQKELLTIEEEKGYKCNGALHDSHVHSNAEFIAPHHVEYIDCEINTHHVQDCNVLKRITHLLEYYQDNQNTQLYDYLSSLENYDFPTFMEDWYQMKKTHLKDSDNINWIRSNISIQCNNVTKCIYVNRYSRNRENENFHLKKEIDYKNIIVTDQMDSIHTFLFHSSQSETVRQPFKNIECDSDEEKYDIEEDDHEQFIWENKPKTITQCNPEQIEWILNNKIFQKLKNNDRDKLIEYKSQIVCYIKDNNVYDMKRKQFMNNISAYLHNKKLKVALGALYKIIMNYDISTLFSEDEEKKMSNTPQSIQQCDIYQIIFITDIIIQNKVQKLAEYKDKITNYLKENKVNGNKFMQISRKHFINDTATYLDNNKMRSPLGILFSNILKYDVKSLFVYDKDKKTNDIWENKPQSIQQCDFHQISFVSDYIIAHEIDKLSKYTQMITNYIVQNQIDGNQSKQMKR
eukprot:306052_1